MFTFCPHTHTHTRARLCVCSTPSQCVSWSTAASARPPWVSSQVCTCIGIWMCVRAHETGLSPTGSMLSPRKADYGTCQGVRNTPHRHSTDSLLSTHLYGCKCKASALRLPPAIWRLSRALPPQLDVKLGGYCLRIFLVCFTNVCCSLTKFELARLAWSCDWFWLEIATHFRIQRFNPSHTQPSFSQNCNRNSGEELKSLTNSVRWFVVRCWLDKGRFKITQRGLSPPLLILQEGASSLTDWPRGDCTKLPPTIS